MTPLQTRRVSLHVGALILLAAVLATTACTPKAESHLSFPTADAVVAALAEALQQDDTAKLQQLLGPDGKALLASGDAVQDKSDRAEFLAAYLAGHKLVAGEGDSMTLVVGANAWPLPIPLVKRDGRWMLDGAQGADELVYRRVGSNELGAIDVSRGYVEAQQEYAAEGRDDDPAGVYAMMLLSDDGLHNGLYWPTEEDETPSPAGPFVASAAAEGYRGAAAHTAYHGYYYRPLYRQGDHANGGPREYFKNGLMTEGFALVAWPADYQSSGVMTFIVNQDGVVFQKDLGENTATVVDTMMAFDPDSSWVALTDASGG